MNLRKFVTLKVITSELRRNLVVIGISDQNVVFFNYLQEISNYIVVSYENWYKTYGN